MGLFSRFRRIKDPVRGTAQVVGISRAPLKAVSGNARMDLVVTVPGHPSFPVNTQFIVRVVKWPASGQVLPVEASASDPRRFRILWDEVTSWDQVSSQRAQSLAQAMNQPSLPGAPAGTPPSTHPPAGGPGAARVTIDGRPATPEEVQQYEALTGIDIDGDGRIAGGAAAGPGLDDLVARALGGAAPPPPPPAGGADHRVAALERLAALRASGALTDAEFEAEKARILDG